MELECSGLYVRLFWFLFRVLLSFAIFARVLTPKVCCSNVLLLACEMQMSMIGHRVMYESSGNGRREMYIIAERVDQRYLLFHGYLFLIRKTRREEALKGALLAWW